MKKYTVYTLPLLMLFFTACLDAGDSQTAQEAGAEIEITLIDKETGDHLSNFEVFILFEIEGITELVGFNDFTSDDQGKISTLIFGPNNDRLTKIFLDYEIFGETRTAEKDIDLQMSFEEPYNSISINMELDVDEVNSE